MAEVSIRDAHKSYGDTEVIHGLDFGIEDGEFAVLVGPSGCGKSTLLRMIAGLERITSGEISIGGRVVNDLEPKDRNIAMVFQNYALYPHMTVYGNMAYGLKIARLSKEDIDRRVQKAARILQLGEFLNRRPGQLSGGQRQRVAMGRAIVREPAVFLFDEPLSNLDAKLRVQMRIEIRKLHNSLDTTSVYVTHDQVEAMTLADRLIVMNDGNAEQIGAPLEVYETPATTFVAGFIGSPPMNFLPATIRDGMVQVDDGGRLTHAGGGLSSADGRAVTLGVRPEHLIAGNGDGAQHVADLEVDLIEALGADKLIYGHFGGLPNSCTLRVASKLAVRTGETIPVATLPEHLHIFDPDTGRRLTGG